MSQPVRIPADVDREDRVLFDLTARQLTILAVTGILLYGAYSITAPVVPLLVFLVVAVPVGAVVATLVLAQRDGISLDKLLLAAVRQRLSPRHRIAATEGVLPAPQWLATRATPTSAPQAVSPVALRLPADAVTEAGVIDLGGDGMAVVATCSTVNFSLRTASEQEALVAVFGRYLHSLGAPVQILVRAQRLDLSGQITGLRAIAGGLPHPALEQAAREHADYLAQLAETTDLLCRQVLLILREPVQAAGTVDGLGGPSALALLHAARSRTRRQVVQVDETARHAAHTRLVRRLSEAVDLLAPAGITVTPLSAGQVTGVLAGACNPGSLLPPTAGMAGADEVITTSTTSEDWDPATFGAPVGPPPGEAAWNDEDDEDFEPRCQR
ncbi:PrgI family protein [Kutzneria albida]|uniref:PrgI family protein n=1 Tax=Kutzneria albida DSM 43870 TaxID=1449976 RepID=W5WK25_9PSEU|nr:PrgI family protein [Kutzneria albida]AHH98529.1 hypothetical protein KALB_5167 [Kutzneria albida DSM 43870]